LIKVKFTVQLELIFSINHRLNKAKIILKMISLKAKLIKFKMEATQFKHLLIKTR